MIINQQVGFSVGSGQLFNLTQHIEERSIVTGTVLLTGQHRMSHEPDVALLMVASGSQIKLEF